MTAETKTFTADLAHLPDILAWVRLQLAASGLPKGDRLHVELAMEEAIVNVINHTTSGQPFDFTLTCRIEPERQIEFDLIDPGPTYNPLADEPTPNLDLPVEELEEGGLGLVLMRKCMDALFYTRHQDQNILTLVKKLGRSE